MKIGLLNKNQWIKLGTLFLACIIGFISVYTVRVELAIIASILMCYTFWNSKNDLSMQNAEIKPDKIFLKPDQLILTITFLIYAILIGLGAAFFSTNLSSATISVILWVISVGLIVSAGIVFDRVKPFAWLTRVKNLDRKSRRNLFIEIAIVFTITGIALALRAINLDHFPFMMHGDEGEMGMESLRVLGIGDPINPFGLGWGPFPNLFIICRQVLFIFLGGMKLG
jgi:hypothetical protein